MDNIKVLEDYVKSANPRINVELRNGIISQDTLLFDTLFQLGSVPPKLYRWIPNSCVIINKEGIWYDPAYMSCSTDVDTFFEHVIGSDLALLIIKLKSPRKCINVRAVLENRIDEGEYILPRNTELKLTKVTKYEGNEQFKCFSASINDLITVPLLESLQIQSIMVYELEGKK